MLKMSWYVVVSPYGKCLQGSSFLAPVLKSPDVVSESVKFKICPCCWYIMGPCASHAIALSELPFSDLKYGAATSQDCRGIDEVSLRDICEHERGMKWTRHHHLVRECLASGLWAF